MGGREIGRQSVGYTEKSQCKADRQAAGIHCSKVVRQAGRQACRQVASWRVAGRQKVSRHSGRQEAGRPA
jgi:hypothetical protein